MFGLKRFWHSTVGKKVVMAVTGIIGILFVIAHMTGNLLMFTGQSAMYNYALLLRRWSPGLWMARGGLLLAVVLHVVAAYQLTMRARAARPQDYEMRRPQVTSLAARTIRWGGVLLLVFIVYHILHMTLGVVHPQFTHLDPYNNVRIGLSNPLVAIFYLISMIALGYHLYHGTWASVRTLGAVPGSAHPLKRRAAWIIAIVVTIGFAAIPVAALLGRFEEMPALLQDVPVKPPAEGSAVTPPPTPSAGEAR